MTTEIKPGCYKKGKNGNCENTGRQKEVCQDCIRNGAEPPVTRITRSTLNDQKMPGGVPRH